MRALAVIALLTLGAGAPDGGAVPPRKKIDRTPKKGAPERPIKVTSESFDALEGGKRLVWKGHVLIVRDDMKVNCDRLVGEGEDAKHINKLTCSGNAHMRQAALANVHPDREAWGEVAVFDNDTAVLTVTGSPHGREGENTMKGEELSFDTRADKLFVKKATIVLQSPPEKASAAPARATPDASIPPSDAATPAADAPTLGPDASTPDGQERRP